MDIVGQWYYTLKVRQVNWNGHGDDRTFVSHPRGNELSRRIRAAELAYNMDSTVIRVYDPQGRCIYLAGMICDDCGHIGGEHDYDVEH